METWQLQDADGHLNEIISASQHAPQAIVVDGEEKAVVLSRDYYVNLQQRVFSGNGKRKIAGSFGEYLAKSPLCGANLKIERDTNPLRDMEW